MRGLVIRSIRRQPDPVPEGRRPFSFFFQPILPALDGFSWLSRNSPIQYVMVGEEIRSIGELVKFEWTEDWVLFQPGTLLPKYAALVIEDWNTLYGFLQKPDPQRFMKELDSLQRQDAKDASAFIKGGTFDEPGYQKFLPPHGSRGGRYLAANVDLVFYNVDGAWWEIYARDETLLESVRRHLRDLPGINLTEQRLEHRLN